MPAQHYPRHTGLKARSPRSLPQPGRGGYDYPRGPYGKTGLPGSTPAAKKTKSQGPDGRKDPSYQGRPRRGVSGQQRQWMDEPHRPNQRASSYAGGRPEFVRERDGNDNPLQSCENPSLEPFEVGRAGGWDVPVRERKLSTGPEHRMVPRIGAITTEQWGEEPRNTIAQRWKADPRKVRQYRPAPNPGKTGARLDGDSQFHPGTRVYGHPDGKPIPGMPSQTGPPDVTVQSRYWSEEGAQEGYAVNRPLEFQQGGVSGWPPGYRGDHHLRGGRLTGQRYFGDLDDQQKIGLPSDSYGIARRRGPRHRPLRFEQPAPWAQNYYDVPPEHGTQSPDMIHRSPGRPRKRRVRRG